LAYALLYSSFINNTADREQRLMTRNKLDAAHNTHRNKNDRILIMRTLMAQLLSDETGFIVSAELVLVATIGVLGLTVGLSEVAFNINQELEDVGSAIGNMNQSFQFNGTAGTKGQSSGSKYADQRDSGDCDCDIVCDVAPTGEDNN
jgi:hypothetical protein